MGGKGRGGGKGGEMIQTLYAYMNKRNFFKKECSKYYGESLGPRQKHMTG
jgi:hypothetical protein